MTLEEAIKHCEEKAKEKRKDYERACAFNIPSEGCLKCAEEHEQLAKWLKELKAYREGLRTCENCKAEKLKAIFGIKQPGKALMEFWQEGDND